jgi:hypothetical protein
MIEYLPTEGTYRAGVCNIGPAEIARRRGVGFLAIGAAIVMALALVIVDAPAPARLLVAIPLAAGFSGLLQAHLRFCANYGWRGLRNLGAIGEAERVDDGAARAADRRRSAQILAASVAPALALATGFALLALA